LQVTGRIRLIDKEIDRVIDLAISGLMLRLDCILRFIVKKGLIVCIGPFVYLCMGYRSWIDLTA
jgi:hypothetical protein